MTSDHPSSTVYDFGPGTVEMNLGWTLADGSQATGRFFGNILPMTLEVGNEGIGFPSCVLVSPVQPCPVISGQGYELGRGRFDANLAAFLGINPFVADGSSQIWLDLIDGDRTSFSRSGSLDLATTPGWNVTAAPEPATLLLFGVSGAVIYWRRRLRQ
jgi:hypothetical protein